MRFVRNTNSVPERRVPKGPPPVGKQTVHRSSMRRPTQAVDSAQLDKRPMRSIPSLLTGAAIAFLSSANRSGAAERTHVHHRKVHTAAPAPTAIANDNRVPAGTQVGDTLLLRLSLTTAAWHILADSAPAFTVAAFQEEGKPPSIPAPLIRVRLGTPIHVEIRNPLDDTLVVRGLS